MQEDQQVSEMVVEARPQRWLIPVVLVLLRKESSYGYELMERIGEYGFEHINPGTLYRTLRQMENQGLCQSTYETSNSGRACRMFSLTDAGERYLASWAEGSKKYQQVLDSFSLAYSGCK